MTEKTQSPSGKGDGFPELLTQKEAIEMLRLDQLGLRDPKESLRYLRRTRQPGYVKVAGKVLIPRDEIAAYLARRKVPASERSD